MGELFQKYKNFGEIVNKQQTLGYCANPSEENTRAKTENNTKKSCHAALVSSGLNMGGCPSVIVRRT